MNAKLRAMCESRAFRLGFTALAAWAVYSLASRGAWPAAAALAIPLPWVYLGLSRLGRSRARLRQATHALSARRAELQTLHTIGRELAGSYRPERVFLVLERECRKILEFDCCLIALTDRSSDRLYAAYHHRRRHATEFRADVPLQPLAHWAREEKRPRRFDDVTLLPADSPLRAEWLAPGTRSLLLVPLIVNREIIGLLALQSERAAAYDDHALDLLTTIGQQAAIVIEGARHYEQATVDSLTGLFVRDYFFTRLAEEDQRARRYAASFALLMIDIDGFKAINDRNGHLAGDQYLREIGTVIRDQLRGADIACRFGGDEFCLLLPNTGPRGAHAIAERIRAAVSSHVVAVDGLALRTTVSIGLAVFPEHDAGDLGALLRKADEALYRAKRAGRDRVVPSAA